MSNEVITRPAVMPLAKVSSDTIAKMVEKTLGNEQVANKVVSNLMATVSNNSALKQCETGSLVSCALMANSLNLSTAQGLGFCAIIPFNNNSEGVKKAQFQIMYKGLIQLAIRSGQYTDIDTRPVYKGQLVGIDELGREVFNWQVKPTGEPIGYFAYFVLINGFRKTLYMSKEDVVEHAKRYSQAYRYDLKSGKTGSKWTTDFDQMAKKTLIKQLLSHWGVLSVEMQNAISFDQKVGSSEANGEGNYLDNTDYSIDTGEDDENRKETTVKNSIIPPKKEEEEKQTTIDDEDPFDTIDEIIEQEKM